MISFDDFSKIELKIGTILEVEEVDGADKLLKLSIDLGEDDSRQILSGVKQWYSQADLIGKQVVVASNLESRTMMGLESQGMILMACDPSTSLRASEPVLLIPEKQVPPGAEIH